MLGAAAAGPGKHVRVMNASVISHQSSATCLLHLLDKAPGQGQCEGQANHEQAGVHGRQVEQPQPCHCHLSCLQAR